MLRGRETNTFYEKCLRNGLCSNHLKELEVKNEADKSELQRKAMLYIRLQIFGPLLFNKPYSFEKMKILFTKFKCFPSKDRDDNKFQEAVMILDSVVVYTLCYLSTVCCAGILFESSNRNELDEPEKKRIVELITKDVLKEDDISYFSPIIKKNFPDVDFNLIKISFVTVLLHVRNTTTNMKLDKAIKQIDVDFLNDPKESKDWNVLGKNSYEECRYDEAIAAYTSAINFNPYSVQLLKRRAQAYWKLEMFKKAALDCYLVLVMDPMSIKTYAQLCYCLCQISSFSESIALAEYVMMKYKDLMEADPQTYCALKLMQDVSKECLDGNCVQMNIFKKLGFGTTLFKEDNSENVNSFVKDVPDLKGATDSENETQDVPDLIGATDSENETPDVPELLDASDSEDSESEVCPDKNGDLQADPETLPPDPETLQPDPETLQPDSETLQPEQVYKSEKEEKCEKLNVLLKKASEQLLDGLGQLAIPLFQEALKELKMYPEVYNYQAYDIISIQYAYGCALCKSKDYDELLKAISVFKDIIEENDPFTFPAAYYGLALVYKKLNGFKEAISCLNIISNFLLKETPVKVCTWPGLSIDIEETSSTHLKTVVADLIKECENHPPPDAVCRHAKCSHRPVIYYSDPDFKGFYTAKCTEQCFLQYHPQCWKILKSEKHYTDKAFLEQNCFTPDCIGVICNIVSISKDGNLEKEFSVPDPKNLPKQKKTKAPKKPEVKEKRRRSKSTSESVEDTAEAENNRKPSEAPEDKSETKPSAPEEVALASELCESAVEKSPQSSGKAEEFFMLKKDKLSDEQPSKVAVKPKEHKKIKNTLSLDEFLESDQTNHVEKPDYNGSKISLQNGYSMKYPAQTSSQKLQTDDIEGVALFYEPPLEADVVESMKKLIFDSMRNLLQKYGPLHIDDPIITDELDGFPRAANRLIADSGGIGEFLKNNLNFALVAEEYVCVVSDVVAAYEKHSYERTKIRTGLCSYSTNTEEAGSLCKSPLNPNAKEYRFVRASDVESGTCSNTHQDEVLDSSLNSISGGISKAQQTDDILGQPNACIALCESGETLPFQSHLEEVGKSGSIQMFPTKTSIAVQTEIEADNTLETSRIQYLQKEVETAEKNKVEYTYELASSKTKIQSLTLTINDQKVELEEAHKKFALEKNSLLKKLEVAEAKANEYESQLDKIGKERKSIQEQLDEILKSQSEYQHLMFEKDKEIETLKENLKTLYREKTENLGRAIYAEDLLLSIKRANNLKITQAKINEATMRFRSLQEAINSSPLGFKRDMELLANRIRQYVIDITRIQNQFTTQIDEQINKVRQGMPLSNMKSVDLPPLEEIPTMANVTYLQMLSLQQQQVPTALSQAAVLPNLRIQPEALPATPAGSSTPNPLLPPTTADLIARMQGQLAAHPVPQTKQVQSLADVTSSPPAVEGSLNFTSGMSRNPSIGLQNSSIVSSKPPEIKQEKNRENISSTSATVEGSLSFTSGMSRNPSIGLQNSSIVSSKPPEIKQEESISSTSAISNPKIDKIGKEVVQGAASNSNLKKDEEPKIVKGASSQSNLKMGEVSKKVIRVVSQENLRPEPKNSYEKLLHKLQAKFPQYTQSQLVDFVKEFREKRHGKLSGLSMDAIINDVSLLIQSRSNTKALESGNLVRPRPVQSVLVNRNFGTPPKPSVERSSSLEKKCPWAAEGAISSKSWTGESSSEEDCSICTEDMSRNAYKVPCGHRFHFECIKAWLNKKSDCPICRVHLLLPEDYPALA